MQGGDICIATKGGFDKFGSFVRGARVLPFCMQTKRFARFVRYEKLNRRIGFCIRKRMDDHYNDLEFFGVKMSVSVRKLKKKLPRFLK